MTTTQVAMIVPALLLWIMLIVQFGLWYHAKQVASLAAEEALDAARVPAGTEAAGTTAAHHVLARSGNLAAPSVSVTRTSGAVVAEVRGSAPRLVPGFSWNVSARTEGPVERFIPEPERER